MQLITLGCAQTSYGSLCRLLNKGNPCRIVICGAGVIGSSIAYYLSKHGLSANVIERTSVANAASGIAYQHEEAYSIVLGPAA